MIEQPKEICPECRSWARTPDIGFAPTHHPHCSQVMPFPWAVNTRPGPGARFTTWRDAQAAWLLVESLAIAAEIHEHVDGKWWRRPELEAR